MTPACFLALVTPTGQADHPALTQAVHRLPRTSSKTFVSGRHRLTVLVGEREPCILLAEGLILGPIFRRGAGQLDGRPDPAMKIDAEGRTLIDDHWGGYVAFLAPGAAETVDIVRAPFGSLACYYVEKGGVLALSSHADLLVAAGLIEAEIDRAALVGHLVRPEIRTSRTALAGLKELPGGYRLRIGKRGVQIEELWSPWCFTARSRQVRDFGTASASVRDAVLGATGAWASVADHGLLTLSGGLDSSIVAACLSTCGAHFSCLTLRTDDAAGDELHYARAVASQLGVPLIDRRFTLADVDVERSDAAHLPRPLARSFAQGYERVRDAVARDVGATHYFNGGGGDNVFCLLQSGAPVADRLLEGDVIGAWHTLNHMCRVTNSDYPAVLKRAFAKLPRSRRHYRWRSETDFLSPEAGALPAPSHLWLHEHPSGVPGKAAHVALLIAFQNHVEGFASELTTMHISPLVSQPVIEACLRVPSWLWCEGGINRAVARAAFADRLPALTIQRRTKGTPDGFAAALFAAQRDKIREMLADGVLARFAIIDREAVLSRLAEPGLLRGLDYLRLLFLTDVEAWARTWTTERQDRHGWA